MSVRRAIAIGVVVWLCVCTFSTLIRCDFAHARELRALPGARPEGVARVVLWKHGTEPGPLASFVEAVHAKRPEAEQDELYYELASLLRVALNQVERNRTAPPIESRDPRSALAWARDHVPLAYRAWFEVPKTAPVEVLPVRRPDFGATPHGGE